MGAYYAEVHKLKKYFQRTTNSTCVCVIQTFQQTSLPS
jgi:hypothetical protein